MDELTGQLTIANQAKQTAETALADFKYGEIKKEVEAMLDAAIDAKKITVEVKNQFAKDYAKNATGLKTVLEAMGAYTSVVNQIKTKGGDLPVLYANKTWDELHRANLLASLKKEHPDYYKVLWEGEHKQPYKEA